jgi:tetrahydromethanopterin S-methyltransferase subunit G
MKLPTMLFFLLLPCAQGFAVQGPPMRATSTLARSLGGAHSMQEVASKLDKLDAKIETQLSNVNGSLSKKFTKAVNSSFWSPILSGAVTIFVVMAYNSVAEMSGPKGLAEFRSDTAVAYAFLLAGLLLRSGLQGASERKKP